MVGARKDRGLWKQREAKGINERQYFVLLVLVLTGLLSILYFADWWFREVHISSSWLFPLLSLVIWWGLLRSLIGWINYLALSKTLKPAKAPKDLSAAIFITSSPGEPLGMFEKTLSACNAIKYPHQTYLLDDTCDPRFKELAAEKGVVHLELVNLPGAKAGKVNAALQLVKEDVILILDPDHLPFPNFLDEVIPFFADEKVGFVQVAQAYYNQKLSFTARAAAEQTYMFYGPTQMALNGHNAAVAIGANCTFRHTALTSIGGHGIGLAEDLVTSIRLHAQGWKSVYHPLVLSRGLVPEDYGSFCKQQLKWSRGVHEVLFAELPRLWKKLSLWQRLSYFMISTYYLNGLISLIFLAIPYLFIWFRVLPANMDFVEFLVRWIPITLIQIVIYFYLQLWLVDPKNERGSHWRGTVLKFGSWPVFLQGLLNSLFNIDNPYIPTSKQAVRGLSPYIKPLLFTQILYLISLVSIIIYRVFFEDEGSRVLDSGFIWAMVAFASLAFIVSLFATYAAWQSRKVKVQQAWEDIPAKFFNHE